MVKKEVVVVASVLKPVDDTRMYEKMAQSLVRTGKFRVNILGFFSNTHSTYRDIDFRPIFHFNRNHYRRLLANWFFFQALTKCKPDVIIVTTPELAPATLGYHLLHQKVKLFYDMVENYQLNLLHHHQNRTTLRKIMAKVITFWEKQLMRKSTTVLFAEKGYYQEKPCLSTFPTLLLENKVCFTLNGSSTRQRIIQTNLSLVYTGTISLAYGIWDALRLVEQLRRILNDKLTFHLIGHVTQSATYHELRHYVRKHSWIRADISQQPIPHQKLINAMQHADIGLVCHQPLPSIRNCFPTRIWEYMACGLPFIVQDHAPWVEYCQPWNCAIPLDFSQSEWPVTTIIKQIYQQDFYSNGIPESIYWDEHSFVSAISQKN